MVPFHGAHRNYIDKFGGISGAPPMAVLNFDDGVGAGGNYSRNKFMGAIIHFELSHVSI